MKIWIRYGAGIGLGLVLGALLPTGGGDTTALFSQLSLIVIQLGRVFLMPMAFFAAIIAADELRSDRRLLRTIGVSFGTLMVVLLIAALVAVLAILVLQPQRIPPMVQEGRIAEPPAVLDRLIGSLPANSFRLLVLGDNALFAVLAMGVLVGLTLGFDREITSPVSLVADSANRVLYRLNSWMTEIYGLLLIVPTVLMVLWMRETDDLQLFGQFLLVTVTAALLLGVVVFPLVIYLLGRREARPLAWIHRMTPAALAALATGDVFVSLSTYARSALESHGVPRRVGGVVPPLMAVFGRLGTALVSIASFLLVIRSYTALEISGSAVFQLAVTGLLYSFMLGRSPAGGVALLLSYIAVRYGRGMEEAYLILLPVMPALERIGAWLDVMTIGFVTQLVSMLGGTTRGQERPI